MTKNPGKHQKISRVLSQTNSTVVLKLEPEMERKFKMLENSKERTEREAQ
jgi:hypothetical protein